MIQGTSVARRWTGLGPYLLSALRIFAAFAFLLHGTQKMFAFPHGLGPNNSTAVLLSQMGLAGVLEVFGGGALLFGLFTRPVAFLLSGEMAVTYFQMHMPRGFWPTTNGGEAAMLFCFIWLYVSAAGPGPISLDALRRK